MKFKFDHLLIIFLIFVIILLLENWFIQNHSTSVDDLQIAELKAIIRELKYKLIRSLYPGYTAKFGEKFVNDDFIWLSGIGTNGTFNGKVRYRPVKTNTTIHRIQVCSSWIFENLRFQVNKPIWNEALIQHLKKLRLQGRSLSPTSYPHAAQDIMLALDKFEEVSSSVDRSQLRVAVWSSITPWIEYRLLERDLKTVYTIDYNEPIIENIPEFKSISMSDIAKEVIRKNQLFDYIIAFSGLEHDGLGRYSDPLNPVGDLMAIKEIWYCLKPGGRLYLGVPTSISDDIVFPGHRIYGRSRLPIMIEDFEMIGRVWDGKVVYGGLEKADIPPTLFSKHGFVWDHQHVLVLKKPTIIDTSDPTLKSIERILNQ